MPQPVQPRTRRDGQVVVATDGPRQPRAQALADSAVATAMLQAQAAAQVVKAAPAPAKGTAATAAKAAIVAMILTALRRFLDRRQADQRQALTAQLAESHPGLRADQVAGILDVEDQAERAYQAKARERMTSALGDALEIEDAQKRREAVQRILDREKRIAVQRETAQAERARGAAEQRALEVSSPQGAKWVLGPAKSHTADCVAMAGKTWPHAILRNYHPPLHAGCACRLEPASADATVASPDEALLGPMQMHVHEAEVVGAGA